MNWLNSSYVPRFFFKSFFFSISILTVLLSIFTPSFNLLMPYTFLLCKTPRKWGVHTVLGLFANVKYVFLIYYYLPYFVCIVNIMPPKRNYKKTYVYKYVTSTYATLVAPLATIIQLVCKSNVNIMKSLHNSWAQ